MHKKHKADRRRRPREHDDQELKPAGCRAAPLADSLGGAVRSHLLPISIRSFDDSMGRKILLVEDDRETAVLPRQGAEPGRP